MGKNARIILRVLEFMTRSNGGAIMYMVGMAVSRRYNSYEEHIWTKEQSCVNFFEPIFDNVRCEGKWCGNDFDGVYSVLVNTDDAFDAVQRAKELFIAQVGDEVSDLRLLQDA